MVKHFLKKKSKRISAKTRYKVEKKVRQHNKKIKRENKKNPKKGKPKDPGVPNSLPFKDKILKDAQEYKERELELKRKQKEERQKLYMEKRGLEGFKKDVEKRVRQFENMEESKQQLQSSSYLDPRSFKPFYREFHKVVESADVILEVLDARDPLGSRCPQVEKAIIDAGPNKRLVLVLNKIDLIPSDNLIEWLKYLRNEFPTLPFKASTQSQKRHISRTKISNKKLLESTNENIKKISTCLGAELLMELLRVYCRNKDIKTSIRVGIVGFPNVGKSSIINSLKRNRACSVGAVPGVTRTMQEVQLDKHIMLLDSPGVVFAQKGVDAAGAALRNAVNIDTLDDAVPAVEAILRRATVQQLMLHYRIPQFSDTTEFLSFLAKRLGRVKKGGIPDTEAAAKYVIRDWTAGKMTYFTKPPETNESQVHLGAEFVQEMAAEFDINSLEFMETDTFSKLKSENVILSSDAFEISGVLPTDGTTEGFEPEEVMDDSKSVVSDALGELEKVKVNVKNKKDKSSGKSDSTEVGVDLEGNQCLNRDKKNSLKKFQKMQKKREKRVDKLSDLTAAMNFTNEDYDFNVDYR